MTVKITIDKDSPAAKVLETFVEEQKAFKKAVEEGKAEEYATTKKFATPLQSLAPQQ